MALLIEANRNRGARSLHDPAVYVSDSFHQAILLVKQSLRLVRLCAVDDSCGCFKPFALRPAAKITWHDSHPGIVADAFYFPCFCKRVNVKLITVVREPDGSCHSRSRLTVGFKIQILLTFELCKLPGAHLFLVASAGSLVRRLPVSRSKTEFRKNCSVVHAGPPPPRYLWNHSR